MKPILQVLAVIIANFWIMAGLLNFLIPLHVWWGFPLYMTIATLTLLCPIGLIVHLDWKKSFPDD